MDYAYNYDMHCDSEISIGFDYVRHSRIKRLEYVATPFYERKLQGSKSLGSFHYEIDTSKLEKFDLFDTKDKDHVFA
jgi:hypothetical protein